MPQTQGNDSYGYTFIKVEERDSVLIARFHNPPRNLMNATMVEELTNLVDSVEKSDSIRALILTGNVPGFFIQHYDVAELDQVATAAAKNPKIGAGDELHDTDKCFLKIEASTKPVIAAINGVATGGGFELALACDFRYLAEDGTVGLPEVKLGILPGAGGTQRLPRLIGMARAMDLILRGRVVDAATADRYGMVHRVVAADALMDECISLAEELAKLPSLAVALIKEAIRKGMEQPLEEALHLEQKSFWKLMRSDEAPRLMKEYAESGQTGIV